MTQEMWNEEVQRAPWKLKLVPVQYKTQEMCNEAVQRFSWTLVWVPAQFVTQEMCNKAMEKRPWALVWVPDQYKTQKMCNEVLRSDPEMLEHVPDWFVTLQEMWHEDFDDHDELITWRDAYIKRKTQKAKIKEELMPVAWHPDRWCNWCVPEHEKKELEKYFA